MSRIAWLLLFAACQPDPEASSLFHNVGMSFEPCNASEITFRNERYGLMPALKVCGSNNVAHYAWNPAGTHLYFDLTLTGNVIDFGQDHRPLSTLPIDQPTGQPAWITDTRLVVPVSPDPRKPDTAERIALYDIEQLSLSYAPVQGLTEVTDVHRGPTASDIYFTGLDAGGARGIYRYDIDDRAMGPAFDWLSGPVETFSMTPTADSVVIGAEGRVTLYSLDGEHRGSWGGVRGTVHPEGNWLAIEKEGEEVSIFYQRSWENQTRRERELNAQRADRMAERFPDWYPKTVQLPTLEFVNLNSGHRGELYSVYGTRFQWYEGQKFFASFLLWGYEGKQLNRNIQLGDIALQLGAIEKRVHLKDLRLLDDQGKVIPPPEDGETTPSDRARPTHDVDPAAGPADEGASGAVLDEVEPKSSEGEPGKSKVPEKAEP